MSRSLFYALSMKFDSRKFVIVVIWYWRCMRIYNYQLLDGKQQKKFLKSCHEGQSQINQSCIYIIQTKLYNLNRYQIKHYHTNPSLMSKKYFINNLNTPFGTALLGELVKQQVQDPVHMCTMKDSLNVKPNGIKKILKRQKPKLFAKKATEQCEVFVYNIDETDVADIEFGLEMMRKPFEDNKTFIFVSDIMVWSGSDRKIKKDPPPVVSQQNAEQGAQPKNQQPKDPQNPDNQQQQKGQQNSQPKQQAQDQQQAPQQKPIQYTFWQDIDYQSRLPLPKYQYIKQIQDKILAFKRQNVKVFIVCAGIIYGCGQNTFYPLFKAAWLQEPAQLPYLDEGNNLIPTIHLKDLVKFVIKLAESPPEESSPYLLAFDLTQDKSQRSLITAIANGIGSGEVKSVSSSSLLQNEQKFKLNIDIRPSKFFVGTPEEPAEFQWTAKNGMNQSIKSLLKDFCDKESLRPMKLVIYQQEKDWSKQSRIDFILKSFSQYYRVPVLSLMKILQYAKQHAQGQLLQDLNQQWQNIMTYLRAGEQRPVLDQTMKVFYRVLRWRLLRNDCTNRGYILHNYPTFRSELEFIFNKISMRKFKRKVPKKKKPVPVVEEKPKQEKGQEGEQNNQNPDNPSSKQVAQPPAAQQPQQPEQQQPQQQAQQQGGPKIQPYYPQTLLSIKRMGVELDNMAPLVEYFITNGIEELVYDTTSKSENSIFQSIRSHVERNGRPNNYLVDEKELVGRYLKVIENENTVALGKREDKLKKDTQARTDVENRRRNLAKEIIEMVENEGEEEIKKMPFRNYLMEFVVPTLNEGLLEVSNIIPNDPVDLLAEYLYQKSYDV